MPLPDSTLSTLTNIRIKVRRLTRSPSIAQITDDEIDTYINTFVLYDFPEQLRLFTLRRNLTFYTQPFIDTYTTATVANLANFTNTIISIHEPIYIGGYKTFYSQSQEQFYGIYPKINYISSIGISGDAVTTTFTGTLSQVPVLQNNVTFSSVDTNSNGLTLIDSPLTTSTGNLIIPGSTPPVALDPLNNINYVTGAFTITFPTAPAMSTAINAQVIPYSPSLPLGVLYFNNAFVLRPVPDQPYRLDCEVYVRPTELLDDTRSPELAEWWQYIAYGASKKIFEDRMDTESIQNIMYEFKQQERLILRRTLVQQGNERTASIYTEQVSFGPGSSGYGWGGGLY